MSLDQPLNRTLYSALKRHFGAVEIKNAGIKMQYDYVYDPIASRLRLVISEPGEQYHVNCDRCGDTRKRLSISANWYHRDREHGQVWKHLINCFNEHCYSDYANRERLHARLFYDALVFSGPRPAPAAIQIRGSTDFVLPSQDLPSGFKTLGALKASHRAITYLVKRGFDPEEIDRLYHVGYTKSDRAPYYARKRLIIPSYFEGKCVGWQARYVGEVDFKADDSPPKYYTCPGMKRGHVVYNLDEARRHETIVIVEGPTDVWRVGQMALAVWGNSLTAHQKKLLREYCRDRSVVMMLDPEIMSAVNQRFTRIRLQNLTGITERFRGGLALVTLPTGTDPGSLERSFLREQIEEQAADQGVRVSWKRA